MDRYILLIDIGSTFTKVTAVDIKEKCILATARAFTTVDSDINLGLNNAIKKLHKQIGEVKFDKMLASSSAAGGLKMVAIGLVPELTVKAAKMAALSAGAKLQKSYSYQLNETECKEIVKLKPDIILLCGGTNGGNSSTILANATILAKNAKLNIPIIVAGNKSVADEVSEVLKQSEFEVIVTENVMPEFNILNIIPAQNVIRNVFLERIIRAKGMTKVESLIEGILMPTPMAVLKAASLLSIGTKNIKGLGDLLIIDIGGATTDVYSICDGKPSLGGVVLKGLPEPFSKRTVEGDLGARYSASNVVEEYGEENFSTLSGLTPQQVKDNLNKIDEDKSIIANTPDQIIFDDSIAGCCAQLSVRRHCGTIETSYGLMGPIFVQNGKDLTNVKYFIGTGGPVKDTSDPFKVLSTAISLKEGLLLPKSPSLGIDKKYILAAMGLLAEYYPEVALEILLNEVEWKKDGNIK